MYLIKKIYTVCLCLSLLSITSCSTEFWPMLTIPDTSTSKNARADDENLRQRLQNSIDDNYPNEAIKIISSNFNILIVGQYSSTATKNKIDGYLRKQTMITQVNDYATIQAKPKLHINNSLQEKAQERITIEKNISGENLQVIAVDHVVYIVGQINYAGQVNLDKAITGISLIDGVLKVVNLVDVSLHPTT